MWCLASVDGAVCGFSAWERFGARVKLHKLYVLRSARVRGVGKRLIGTLIDEQAKRAGTLRTK